MRKEAVILVAENGHGNLSLTDETLQRAGIWNQTIRFSDGQQLLDFLFRKDQELGYRHNKEYLLLLAIPIPKVGGVQVLEKIKQDTRLKKIPVIILAAMDDPDTIEHCHKLGCSIYIVKPVEYNSFVETVRKIGLFLSAVEVPKLSYFN